MMHHKHLPASNAALRPDNGLNRRRKISTRWHLIFYTQHSQSRWWIIHCHWEHVLPSHRLFKAHMATVNLTCSWCDKQYEAEGTVKILKLNWIQAEPAHSDEICYGQDHTHKYISTHKQFSNKAHYIIHRDKCFELAGSGGGKWRRPLQCHTSNTKGSVTI